MLSSVNLGGATTIVLAVVAGCAAPAALRPTSVAQAGTVRAASVVAVQNTLLSVYAASPSPSAVMAVAGNCPAHGGPMRPASAGAIADLNGDRYVCTQRVRSIDGDTLRVTVDNDVPMADSAQVEFPYVFNG